MKRSSLMVLLLVLVTAGGCSEKHPPAAMKPMQMNPASPAAAGLPTSGESAPVGSVTLVTDRSLVCMVNDQFMGQAQIPVVVNGNTYYGCCPACKERLSNDKGARTSVDPISKRPVDKASAIIGKAASGAAVYFENEQNLVAYSRQPHAK